MPKILIIGFIFSTVFSSKLMANDAKINQINNLILQYETHYSNSSDSIELGLKILENALSLSQKSNYKLGILKLNYQIGRNLFVSSNNNSKAISYFYECIRLCELEGNQEYFCKSYNYLGLIYRANKKYDDALRYFHQTIACKWNADPKFQNVPLYLSGLCYFELKKYDSALRYLNYALDIARKNNLEDRINECNHGIARVLIKQNKLSEAKKLVLATMKSPESIANPISSSVSYQLLGTVLYFEKSYDRALSNALLADSLSRAGGEVINQIEINQLLSDIYKVKNNFPKAYDYVSKNQLLKEQMYSSDISTQINLSQAQHVFDKEKLILNSTISTQEKERKVAMIAASIFGLLLLAIGGLLFFVRKERKKSEDLLLNILPRETVQELKLYGKAIAKRHESTTVMFCDIKQFSTIAELLHPEELVEMLDIYFRKFDEIITTYGLEKIKIIGDAYMCVGGLQHSQTSHVENTILAVFELKNYVDQIHTEMQSKYGQAFEFRFGVHTGSLVSGVVGYHKYAYDVWGDTVNIAARMESSGEPGKINISSAVYDVIHTKFSCEYRGSLEVKNNKKLDMYFVS
jgi:adenylate cyclase